MLASAFGSFLGMAFVGLAVCLLFALVWYVFMAPKRKLHAAWYEFAGGRGLVFRPAGSSRDKRQRADQPMVEGDYRDRAVTLTLRWVEGPDDVRELRTRLSVRVGGGGQGRLRVGGRDPSGSTPAFLGMTEEDLWRSGDEAFNAEIEVLASSPELAAGALADAGLRGRLLELLGPAPGDRVVIERDAARWESPRQDCGPETLTAALETLCDLAEAAERAADGP